MSFGWLLVSDEEDGHAERSSSGSAAEADDEGIERDSGENDEDSHLFTLNGLIKVRVRTKQYRLPSHPAQTLCQISFNSFKSFFALSTSV